MANITIRLDQLRLDIDSTKQEFANRVDFHLNQVKRYELGKGKQLLEIIEKIALKISESLILKHNAKQALVS